MYIGPLMATQPPPLKCDKCKNGYLDRTPTREQWQQAGKPLLCEKCWPPLEDKKE